MVQTDSLFIPEPVAERLINVEQGAVLNCSETGMSLPLYADMTGETKVKRAGSWYCVMLFSYDCNTYELLFNPGEDGETYVDVLTEGIECFPYPTYWNG